MAVTYRDANGSVIELPKLTLALSDRMDEIQAETVNAKRYALQLDFLRDVLGSEYVEAELDGTGVDDVDLVSLNILYTAIVNAYTLPVQQAQLEAARKQLQQVQPMLQSVDQMARMQQLATGNAVTSATRSRQGFRNVK